MSEERRLTPPPSPPAPVPRNVIFELEQRSRIAELERENRELRLAANLHTNGKITTLVGIEPSRLRELERYERRWETCERLVEVRETRDGASDIWCIHIVREEENTFAAAVDNASTEDTTNAK